MASDEIKFTWASDSGGAESMHLNRSDISLDTAYVGRFWQNREDKKFYVHLIGCEKPEGPFESIAHAKRVIVAHGERLDKERPRNEKFAR